MGSESWFIVRHFSLTSVGRPSIQFLGLFYLWDCERIIAKDRGREKYEFEHRVLEKFLHRIGDPNQIAVLELLRTNNILRAQEASS